MNIGFDAKRAFLNRTGLGNYGRSVIRLLCLHAPANAYFAYTPPGPFVPEAGTLAGLPNLTVRTPGTGAGRLFSSVWRTFGIARELRRDRIDVYHGLSFELPAGIGKTGIRTLVSMPDMIFLRHPEQYPLTDRLVYGRKVRHAVSVAHSFTAISEEGKQDLVRWYGVDPGRITVVYPCAAPAFYRKAGKEDLSRVRRKYGLPGEYLLYVGTINERKNLLSLVRALPLLPDALSIPLVAAGGGGAYRRKVERFAARGGLQKRVRFIGVVESGDLPALYQGAACFIFPSVAEGFGIPVIEALAGGVPVVTSDRGALREAGGPESLYVDPLDPAQIARAVGRVLEDGGKRNAMIEAGILHAGKFSEEETARGLLKFYGFSEGP